MRLRHLWYCLSIGMLVLVTMQPAYGMRCSGKLVHEGDTAYQVVEKCGEPDHIEAWEEERIKLDHYYSYDDDDYEPYRGYREPFLVKEYVRIEEWTYNRGPTTFIRYLIFENGRLKKIYLGDKGSY